MCCARWLRIMPDCRRMYRRIEGDPTEGALLTLAAKSGRHRVRARGAAPHRPDPVRGAEWILPARRFRHRRPAARRGVTCRGGERDRDGRNILPVHYPFNCHFLLAPSCGIRTFIGSRPALVSIAVAVALQALFTYAPLFQQRFGTTARCGNLGTYPAIRRVAVRGGGNRKGVAEAQKIALSPAPPACCGGWNR